MNKTVLTFGLISGAIMASMLAITLPFQDDIGFGNTGMIIGYTSMVAAFMLVFFGIRSYRDNVAGGSVSFGRAFSVGALIVVIGSVCYVTAWEVIYFNFAPDFLAKYQAHAMEKVRASGASQAEIERKSAEMKKLAALYQNPAINSAITFLEPLPVGLLIALVSAGALRRKPKVAVS